MPRNVTGQYTLPAGNPVITGTIIASSWANPTMDDLATAITGSLSRLGLGAMEAPLRVPDGERIAPTYTFVNDILSGRYRFGASDMRDVVTGVDVVSYTPAAVSILVDLITSGALTIGGDLSVTGNIAATGGLTLGGDLNTTGRIIAADGTMALPVYTFTTDPDTGRYLAADADMRDTVAGVDVNVGHAILFCLLQPLNHSNGCLYIFNWDFPSSVQSSLLLQIVFLEAFEQLIRAGKIRSYGISTLRLDVLERFNKAGGCFSCQLDYSLVNRTPEKDLLPYCLENNIATLIRGPLAQGLLSGKYDETTIFPDSIRAKWNEAPGRDKYLAKLSTMRSYQALARERTWVEAALMAVLNHPAVTTVIPGAKNPDQVIEHVRAAGQIFSSDEKVVLDRA